MLARSGVAAAAGTPIALRPPVKPLLLVVGAVAGGLLTILATATGDEIAPPEPASLAPPTVLPAEALGTHADDRAEPVRQATDCPRPVVPPLDVDAVWYDVLVVDGVTQRPVPGAELRWFGERAADLARWDDETDPVLWRRQEDNDRVAARHGWRTTSDCNGIARVGGNAWLQVIVTHGERYGTLRIAENTVLPRGGYRIELHRDAALEVLAIDEEGIPVADLPVHVAYRKDARTDRWSQMPIAVTDARGRASLRHAQTCLHAGLEAPAWVVVPHYLGTGGVALDPSALPGEPLLLRTPCFGKVRACQWVPGVGSAVFDAPRWKITIGALHDSVAPSSVAANGWVEFSHVPIAQVCELVPPCRESSTVDGPRRAGDVVEVRLDASRYWTQFRGRLIDEEGAPVTRQCHAWGAGAYEVPTIQPDDDGGFSVLVTRRGDEAVELSIGCRVAGPWAWARWRGAVPTQGIVDIGTLVLRSDPVVVTGRFVQRGRSVARMPKVMVEIQRHNDDGVLEWVHAKDLLDDVERDGTFEIRGDAANGRLRLSFADETTFLPIAPVEFDRGTRGLVVEVDAGHPLAASVQAPEAAVGELVAELVPRTVGGARYEQQPLADDRGCLRLQWPVIVAGVYTLRLRLFAFQEPLLEIPDVQVPAPAGGDSRLVDIDLHPLVRVVVLTRLDANGESLDEYTFVSTGHRGTDGSLLGFEPHGDHLVLPQRPVSLVISVNGHRPQTVLCSAAMLTLRFEPWPTVQCDLDLPEPLRDLSAVLCVRPSAPHEDRYATVRGQGAVSELAHARDSASYEPGEPISLQLRDGPHEFVLQLWRNCSARAEVVCTPSGVFVGADRIRVKPDPVALHAALERLRPASQVEGR